MRLRVTDGDVFSMDVEKEWQSNDVLEVLGVEGSVEKR